MTISAFLRHARRTVIGGLVAATLAPFATSASAQTPNITTFRVASGLVRPDFVTAPRGDFGRLFVLEQRGSASVTNRGAIRVLTMTPTPTSASQYTLLATPFLNVAPVSTASEQGLLGLAFHPDYLNNGYFWINYTASNGSTVLARYRALGDPRTSNVADTTTFVTVLIVAQPFTNHNGGWIAFGPDGYLYMALGDGGSANDPNNRAQNPADLLGKIIRIDVDGLDNIPGNADDSSTFTIPGGTQNTALYSIPATNPFPTGATFRPEVWAYGVRNPWRNSFDRLTGALYIADVGQDAVEEINYQPPSTGGRNYGWRCYEGNSPFNTSGCAGASSYTFPIFDYPHSGGACSITGGYAYRGCNIPALQGTYFFADYCSNQISSFNYSGTGVIDPANVANRTAQLDPDGAGALNVATVSSFGEDAYGELYITDIGGEVFKIIPGAGTSIGADCDANGLSDACQLAANPALDCNRNGTLDSCEIAANSALDCNTNGILDACEIAANPSIDCDRNGIIDTCQASVCCWDFNTDGVLSPADIFAFLNGYFNNDPRTDANFDGQRTPADIFAYLNGYFTGCPGL